MSTCWLCGYSTSKGFKTKFTYVTKTGKNKTVIVHPDCLERHIQTKKQLQMRLRQLLFG